MDAVFRTLADDGGAFRELKIGLEKLKLNDTDVDMAANGDQPPIECQAEHNNQKVNWSKCTDEYPVDMRAFRHYKPTSEGGELVLRHGIGQEATAAALSREQQAKNREKRKVIKAFFTTGSQEQMRLVLLSFLCDPKIRKVASSIGVNMREARIGHHILRTCKRLMDRTQRTSNKNGRLPVVKKSLVKYMSVAFIKTPPKIIGSHSNDQTAQKSRQPAYGDVSRRDL